MAEIVAGIGVPHTPAFPAQVAKLGPDCETARLYAEIAAELEAAAPDALVIFTDDHFNTFFLDNFPTFAVGIAEATSGPNDQTPMPHYRVAVPAGLAAHIRTTAITRGFDIALVQDFDVDHATMVPLHFLTPHMKVPVVPIFINALAPPLPGARRCHALGEAVGAAIECWPQPLRVAVIGSGSFSLEIGGPRIPPGERACTPNPQWAKRVQDHMEEGRIDELIAEATFERLMEAGNIGGELLNWIAMLGVIGARKPLFIKPQIKQGHAYGVWR